MREIKFRGKRVDNGQWVYGDITRIFPAGKIIGIVDWEFRIVHEVDPETVGQYTGLKDKNGIEIYEGDIIRIEGFSEPMTVYFKDGCFGWGKQHYGKYSFDPFGIEQLEVIGNIFDNPELLPSKKENQDGTHKDNKA